MRIDGTFFLVLAAIVAILLLVVISLCIFAILQVMQHQRSSSALQVDEARKPLPLLPRHQSMYLNRILLTCFNVNLPLTRFR